jgi:hypothetical protein
MSAAEEKLAQLRAARDAARAEFLEHSGRIRDLAKPGELSRRITRDVQVQGRKALSQAMEIAADERGVLAGTLTALMLWMASQTGFCQGRRIGPQGKTRMGQDAESGQRRSGKSQDRLRGKSGQV